MSNFFSIEQVQQETNASIDLRDYMNMYVDSCKVPVDNETLYIKCHTYLDTNYPQLSSFQKARILWKTAIIGEIFDF